jgi:predicted DNA-binding antitoxin AbrB/MazE fold protein
MAMQVDAIYKEGVLRPLQPLDLAEDERVRVSIAKDPSNAAVSHLDVEYLERLELELRDAPPAPGLEEVRRRLAKIPGSPAADFIAEREDR